MSTNLWICHAPAQCFFDGFENAFNSVKMCSYEQLSLGFLTRSDTNGLYSHLRWLEALNFGYNV